MNIEIKLEITIEQFWYSGIIPVIHEDTSEILIHCLEFHYSHFRIKGIGIGVTGLFITHASNDFILQYCQGS